MTQLHVRLHRDSFNTPWGFRVQGGRDTGQALSIQRVFSNSPAEGELQRGDLILAIGGTPGSELTNGQALDLIKRGGGYIELFIQRPVPVRAASVTTFSPQRPKAPTLQLKPVYAAMPGPGGGQYRQNANPCFNPNFFQQYSPSSPIHPPPWTVQNFAPKKVSKLSRLGGGGESFGQDYGTQYGTVPRRRHSTQVSITMPHLQGSGGNPPRVSNLSHLGGAGYDFGADYCTLPRRSQRQLSQPPVSRQPAMPVSSSYGFSPKKVTLTNLGGGGPSFGSDYTRQRPSSGGGAMQPVHVHIGGGGSGGRSPYGGGYYTPPDSMNRMHDSFDGMSLSPRSQDYAYQAPPSPGGQYIPTGVRLDMEREQELRQQSQHPQEYQPPSQQCYYNPPQPFLATGVRLDQQMAPIGKSSAPKVLRPKPGKSGFNFGVDYSKPQAKTSSVTWRPQQPAQRPVNVPPPQPEIVQSTPPSWGGQQDEVDQPHVPPAWRTSLKATGVKPWDKDLEYTAGQQEAPRSVGQPSNMASRPASYNHHPAPPPPPSQKGRKDAPQVVHLQYNSPMGLYSKENVQATYAGQTKAMATGGVSSPGSSQPVKNPDKPGDRDWTQSAVYRMIYEEEHRGRPGGQQQQQQQQKAPPPPPAPKPQAHTFQQSFASMDGEYGTSDF